MKYGRNGRLAFILKLFECLSAKEQRFYKKDKQNQGLSYHVYQFAPIHFLPSHTRLAEPSSFLKNPATHLNFLLVNSNANRKKFNEEL